ncbi:hypothetical protein K438DRAFT_1984599 [Mycena galopus ATCC 62051]|nr:hypothetical protein K438DRAFT_1984599 [Mycena galopus ATCC 62051]
MQTYSISSSSSLTTPTSGSITLSPSLATSLSTSPSMASPSIFTSTSTSTAPRVRFDAECVHIPELGSFNPKRPRIVTKSHSLPLWKNTRDEEDEQHVVLKVAVSRWVMPSFFVLVFGFVFVCDLWFPPPLRAAPLPGLLFLSARAPRPAPPFLQIQKILLTLARTQRLALPAIRLLPLPSCLRSPSITSASAALSSPPEASPSPAASFGSLGAGNPPPTSAGTSTSPPNTSDTSSTRNSNPDAIASRCPEHDFPSKSAR